MENKTTEMIGLVSVVSKPKGIKFKDNNYWFNPFSKEIADKVTGDLVGKEIIIKIDKDNFYHSFEVYTKKKVPSFIEPTKEDIKTNSLKVKYLLESDIELLDGDVNDFCRKNNVKYMQHILWMDRILVVMYYE